MSNEQTSYSAVLGVLLANIRREKGLEQSKVAEKMGLSQASYSRLESGSSSFSVDQMFLAAEAVGVSSAELTDRLNKTINRLRASGVKIVAGLRGNASAIRNQGDGSGVGKLIVGAALGALLMGMLTK